MAGAFYTDVRALGEVDSTNEYVKRLARSGAPSGLFVWADSQTAGKGRLGRKWVSPPGENVYYSLLLRPGYPAEKASAVTLVAGMAVAAALKELCGKMQPEGQAGAASGDIMIKWPNDVVIGTRKVSGTLTELEMAADGSYFLVIGTGINIAQTHFADEIADKATSVLREFGQAPERQAIIGAVMNHFQKRYEKFEAAEGMEPLIEEYDSMLANAGRRVKVLDPHGEYEAEAAGIDGRGRLIVTRGGGAEERIDSGEVSVRGIDGYV